MPTPGEIIKRLREKKGLTPPQLALVIGVSRAAVHKWETGKSEPTLSHAIVLAKFFGIPLATFGDADDERAHLEAEVRKLLLETLNGPVAAQKNPKKEQ